MDVDWSILVIGNSVVQKHMPFTGTVVPTQDKYTCLYDINALKSHLYRFHLRIVIIRISSPLLFFYVYMYFKAFFRNFSTLFMHNECLLTTFSSPCIFCSIFAPYSNHIRVGILQS